MNGEDIRLVLAGEVQHDERGRGLDDLLNLAAEHSPFDDPDFRDEAVLFLADSMYNYSFPPKMRAHMESWLDKIARMAQPSGDWVTVPAYPTKAMIESAEEAYMPFGDMEIALRRAILSAPTRNSDE